MTLKSFELFVPSLGETKPDILIQAPRLVRGNPVAIVEALKLVGSSKDPNLLGRVVEAKIELEKLGMPGELAVFPPPGSLGQIMEALRQAVLLKGGFLEPYINKSFWGPLLKESPESRNVSMGIILDNPNPEHSANPSLWHTGIPANEDINLKLNRNNPFPTTQEDEAKKTIDQLTAEHRELTPDFELVLVGVQVRAFQALVSAVSDYTMPPPLPSSRGLMRDLNTITSNEDPMIGHVCSLGGYLYLGRSYGDADASGGVSFGVIKN